LPPDAKPKCGNALVKFNGYESVQYATFARFIAGQSRQGFVAADEPCGSVTWCAHLPVLALDQRR
jgi:hypothetical protein